MKAIVKYQILRMTAASKNPSQSYLSFPVSPKNMPCAKVCSQIPPAGNFLYCCRQFDLVYTQGHLRRLIYLMAICVYVINTHMWNRFDPPVRVSCTFVKLTIVYMSCDGKMFVLIFVTFYSFLPFLLPPLFRMRSVSVWCYVR